MGEVYLVRHVHLQELRVVKIIRQEMAADPSAQKRFMREARLATQIKHPNVAILYDFSRLDDGSFYMVWEHIQGEEVGGRVRRLGPFPLAVSVQLGVQALRGLEAIHAAGIPIAMPMTAVNNASLSIMPTTVARRAPSAIRTPISGVRRTSA